MSLTDLASLGSFISGLAVLVSLVFLYFQLRQVNQQVRQAELNQQASITEARATRVMTSFITQLTADISVAVGKGLSGAEDITALELQEFNAWLTVQLVSAEASYYQNANGMLGEAANFSFIESAKQLLSRPGYRAAWRRRRMSFHEDFRLFMDRILEDTAQAPPADVLAQWKEDIAAELCPKED
jgi:hypothetical protein